MSEVEVALKQVWKKLYNPKSGSPDVELGAVAEALACALANSNEFSDLSRNTIERWVLAYVSILGTIDSESLQWEAAYKVPYYSDDGYGYYKPRPYVEYEAEQASARERVKSAIQSLLDDGYLKYDNGGRLQCVL